MFDKNLHHAYLIEGETDSKSQEIVTILEKDFGLNHVGNPDFHIQHSATFTIEEARLIKDKQTKKSISGEKKIFIISFNTITSEAQNSLLKVLEEPTKDSHFFLITPYPGLVLPTVRSRLIYIENKKSKEENTFAKKFIQASKSERLEMVALLVKDIKDEKKDKNEAIKLLQGIERYIYELYRKDRHSKYTNVLKDVEKSLSYMNDRSSSLKILLEHIALVI